MPLLLSAFVFVLYVMLGISTALSSVLNVSHNKIKSTANVGKLRGLSHLFCLFLTVSSGM